MATDLKRKRLDSLDAEMALQFLNGDSSVLECVTDRQAQESDTTNETKEQRGERERIERLRKSREKARARRNKKKEMVESMQQNVVMLSRRNADLKRKNDELRAKIFAM